MAAKKAANIGEKLKEISNALKRESQIQNWQKELEDKKQILDKQIEASKRDLKAVQEILSKDKEIVAVAREMLSEALQQQSGDGVAIYNPKYVTTEDKEKLLAQILDDYKAENPKAKSMGFGLIKNVLLNRYKIDSPSAGLFFRNQLKEYKTEGGNKNKSVLL